MTQRKSTANYLICMAMNIFCQSVLDMVFFSPEREKKKKKGEYAQNKIRNPILKIRKSYEPAARSHNHAVTQPSTLAQMS